MIVAIGYVAVAAMSLAWAVLCGHALTLFVLPRADAIREGRAGVVVWTNGAVVVERHDHGPVGNESVTCRGPG